MFIDSNLKVTTGFPSITRITSCTKLKTYKYNLPKYLCNLLSTHLSEQYCTMETFTFIEELNLVSLVDKCLISSDVISQFTNIPLSETIILTVNLIKTFQPDQNISEKDSKSVFNFATRETHFDGAAMGSPLASVLANLFMGHYEKEWLSNYDRIS